MVTSMANCLVMRDPALKSLAFGSGEAMLMNVYLMIAVISPLVQRLCRGAWRGPVSGRAPRSQPLGSG